MHEGEHKAARRDYTLEVSYTPVNALFTVNIIHGITMNNIHCWVDGSPVLSNLGCHQLNGCRIRQLPQRNTRFLERQNTFSTRDM